MVTQKDREHLIESYCFGFIEISMFNPVGCGMDWVYFLIGSAAPVIMGYGVSPWLSWVISQLMALFCFTRVIASTAFPSELLGSAVPIFVACRL